MAPQNSVPIPQGATIGDPVQASAPAATPAAVPIPQGATIGDPIGTPHGASGSWDQPPAPERGVLENITGGIAKGAAKTVTGGMNLLGEGIEKVTGQPKGSLTGTFQDNREQPSLARDVGEGGENLGEWAMGDEVLEGLVKATKIVDMAKSSSLVRKTMELAKEHPVLQKIILGGGKAAVKGGIEGGVQGAVKGAATGNAAGEAEAGALGGGLGGFVGESASVLAGELGKAVGIGTSAEQDAMRGFKPNKRNFDFAEKFNKAAPVIDAEPAFKQAKSVADQVEAIDTARENWWDRKIKPLVDDPKNANVPLSGLALHDYIEKSIPPAMERNSPAQAQIMHDMAEKYFPTKNPNAQYQLQYKKVPLKQAEEDIEHYNALVSSTGYWSKLPEERRALLQANGELAGNMAVANALREEMYDRLGILVPGTDMRDLKATYGALRNVGNELRGQMNVQGRQAPTSLKQLIGITTGVAMGGVYGMIAAGIPFVDKNYNSVEKLTGRAVQKAAHPGEEGMVVGGVKKAAGAGKAALAPVTSIGAQHLEESMPAPKNSSEEIEPQGGRVTFRSSDGAVHSVPSQHLQDALALDPHLTVIS